MLVAAPFSPAFWGCYLCGGLSDLLDGAAARAFGAQSASGAKLDSIADTVFAAAVAVFAVRNITLPAWMLAGAIFIAALRLLGLGIGFARFRAFSSLHTYANKAAGALIFAFPLLCRALGATVSGIVVLAAALLASAEEVVITAKARELDRDCKGLFARSHRRAQKNP